MRLLEQWQDRKVEIGGPGPYGEEGLRLRPVASLGFAPADVQSVQRLGREYGDGQVLGVALHFMGLYGVSSPSPIYLTELVSSSEVDTLALTDLLDIFNHRLLSFYYRAWEKYRFPYRYRSGGRRHGGSDQMSSQVLSLAGLDEPSIRELAGLPIGKVMKYVGLLAQRVRSAAALERLVSDYLDGICARLEEWVLQWVRIPAASRNTIGQANSRLSRDLTLGGEVPDRSGKFRVRLGPLSLDEYMSLLPEGRRFRELCALIKLWVGDRCEFDVELRLRGDQVPEARFGSMSGSAALGWTSWVTSSPGLAEETRQIFPPPPANL